jgi:hypothetical protein
VERATANAPSRRTLFAALAAGGLATSMTTTGRGAAKQSKGKGKKKPPLALVLASVLNHEANPGFDPPQFLLQVEVTAYDLRPSPPVASPRTGANVPVVASTAVGLRTAIVQFLVTLGAALFDDLPADRVDVLLV